MSIIKIINGSQFDEIIGQGVVLVDFNAPWCAPCRVQAPVIEEIAADFEGKAVIVDVNIDNNINFAKRYGVHSIPTIILFKDGKEILRFVGLQPQEKLSRAISQVL